MEYPPKLRMNISTAATSESRADLIQHLAAGGQTQVAMFGDLGIIVHKADRAIGQQRQHRDPDIGVAQVRPQQRGDHDRNDDQHAAHGGRAGFLLVRLGSFFANVLADLELAQLGDQPRSQRDAEKQRGQAGEGGARGYVAEDAERRNHRRELFVEQEIQHVYASTFSVNFQGTFHLDAARSFKEDGVAGLRPFAGQTRRPRRTVQKNARTVAACPRVRLPPR